MGKLREILDLPEQVTKSAFVVRLREAVQRPKELLDSYAITADIRSALDHGLGLVHAAIDRKQNAAAYVHGSFGSGKSHYMAVLSLLLGASPEAIAEPELHELVAKHAWLKQTKVLRLHINMIDADTLGDRLFAEYLAETRRLHPDAAVAPLFADAALFENAKQLRAQLGDDAFFATLGKGSKSSGRFGKLAEATGTAGWTPSRFDEAVASTDPKLRAELFSALVKTLFPAFAAQRSAYLEFDAGLAALGAHAKELGYAAVVFFLDELVLWLATKASNPASLNDEIGRLAKLVEGQASAGVPIVSFAARQRDIGEMVGEQYTGHDAQTVRDKLKYWDGRFDTITLPDKDLPAIIEKRVVRPKDARAEKALDEAFVSMRRTLGQQAYGTLLGEIAGGETAEDVFRKVYPFSPALVEALITMSHYLQRERTALRLLVELLVEHLEDFELGKLVPVGDLFDALAEGDDPMDGAMRLRFQAAKRVYEYELLPIIREQNRTNHAEACQRLRTDEVAHGCANCPKTTCRNDNRLAKTLLLASLAPAAPVFRELSVSRLVQLNHGTLKSPVPGAEANMAAQKLRTWASQVGKLRPGQGDDPKPSIVLEGVDLRPYIESASGFDSPGAQRAKLREILFEALELRSDKPTIEGWRLEWRGTDRRGSVHFGNVRDMDDATLRAGDDDAFRVVIDYPFDDAGRSPQEDEARLAKFLESAASTNTVVWLPSFLSEAMRRELGELCVLDRLLEPSTFTMHFSSLTNDDRERAREELRSRADQKRDRLRRALDAAYGLVRPSNNDLDPSRSVSQHFYVLRAGAETIGNVSDATLARGLESAVRALLDQIHPRHPRFVDKATRSKLEAELELVRKLVETDGQRLPLSKAELGALVFADALGLVTVRDAQATLRHETYDELERRLRAEGHDLPEVRHVKAAFQRGGSWGLTAEVADFVVLVYATVKGREVLRAGRAVEGVQLGKLDADAELSQPELAGEADWHRALDVAGRLFGVATGRALTPKNHRRLHTELAAKLAQARKAQAHGIAALLEKRLAQLGLAADAPRWRTAHAVAALLDSLEGQSAVQAVRALAALVPETSLQAMKEHLLTADTVARALADDVRFASFPALQQRDDEPAKHIVAELGELLTADETVRPLSKRLGELSLEAQGLMQAQSTPRVAPLSGAASSTSSATGKLTASMTITSTSGLDELRAKLEAELSSGEPIVVQWSRPS